MPVSSFRIIPKAWTHGLRDNEYAQRYLVKSFKELTSAKAAQLRESIKNMMCLVDERSVSLNYNPLYKSEATNK
jgi:hypothetical protein